MATVPPFSATLVSLAALGESDARVVLQLPHGARMAEPHGNDILKSAMNLHTGKDGQQKVVEVDALQSLRDAKTQCAVSPGAPPSPQANACLKNLNPPQGPDLAPGVVLCMCRNLLGLHVENRRSSLGSHTRQRTCAVSYVLYTPCQLRAYIWPTCGNALQELDQPCSCGSGYAQTRQPLHKVACTWPHALL